MLYDIPFPNWSVIKFSNRYGLDPERDFYITGEGKLFVRFTLPDNPPIFEHQDPPQAQGRMFWEDSGIPGALRLMVEHNGQRAVVVGAVGADTSRVAMYQSPGPVDVRPAGPRREFHLDVDATVSELPVPPVDGDTLYRENDGEYRYSNGAWRRILYGPVLGSPADQPALYADLDAAMDAAINPAQGPAVDPRVRAVLVELRKLI